MSKSTYITQLETRKSLQNPRFKQKHQFLALEATMDYAKGRSAYNDYTWKCEHLNNQNALTYMQLANFQIDEHYSAVKNCLWSKGSD
jgi:hypothetical protein